MDSGITASPEVPAPPLPFPDSPTYQERLVARPRLAEEDVVSVTAVGHALCHVGELVSAGALLALKSEFDLSRRDSAALPAVGFVLMGLGALPAGLIADVWGPVRVLKVYFLALAAAAVAVALAPDVWALFAALTALGLALSLYHPAGTTLLSLGARARGRAMGVHGVAGNVGVAVGPTLGFAAAAAGSWRLAYAVVAVGSLAGAALLFYAARRGGGDFAPGPRAAPAPGRSLTWGRHWVLVLVFAAGVFGGFNYRCLTTALPTFLSGETAADGKLLQGGLFAFLALAAGGVGQMYGGWLADRVGPGRAYLGLVCALVPSALLLGTVGGTAAALPVACVVAVCLFAQQPTENILLAEYTSAARRSLSYGTKFTLTFGIGAVGAYVTGLVWDATGELGPVFFLIAASAVLMAALLVPAALRARAS